MTKTYLYYVDPLKSDFCISKTEIYKCINLLFFLFLLQNIECGYSIKPPPKAVLTRTHNLCFEQKYEKYQNFYLNFSVFWWYFLFFVHLNPLDAEAFM